MYMKLNKMIQDVGVLNNDELNKVIEAVKLRRNQLHFQDAHSLKLNDRVSFKGSHGRTETGTVEKLRSNMCWLEQTQAKDGMCLVLILH